MSLLPAMFGALKIGNLCIVHVRKPYRLIRSVSSSTSPNSVASARFKVKSYSGRLVIPHGRSAKHHKVLSKFSDFWNHGQILCSYASNSRNGDREEEHMRRSARSGTTGIEMDTKASGKIDEHDESGESPPQKYSSDDQSMSSSKLLTLPTILTIGRVAAAPLLAGAFYSDSWWGPAATTGIFIAAAITDWLDGYLARKMKVRTQFGAFLDPVADKLIVATTLILLCSKPYEGHASWLMTVPAIAIIGREITMSAVREWAAAKDRMLLKAVAVNEIGKWKTATQMTALTILLASRDGSLFGGASMASSGVVLLYVSAWLSLWSLFIYVTKIWKHLLL